MRFAATVKNFVANARDDFNHWRRLNRQRRLIRKIEEDLLFYRITLDDAEQGISYCQGKLKEACAELDNLHKRR